jgi:hypothetical protein
MAKQITITGGVTRAEIEADGPIIITESRPRARRVLVHAPAARNTVSLHPDDARPQTANERATKLQAVPRARTIKAGLVKRTRKVAKRA